MTNDAASDVRTRGVTTPISISVQVETAWGGSRYLLEPRFRTNRAQL